MAKRVAPNLTEIEMEILQIVWDRASASVEEVLKNLPPHRDVAYTTVQTRLNRMVDKGVLLRAPDGRMLRYVPRTPEAETRRLQVRDIIGRFFGGSAKDLVLSLFNGGDISAKDIADLEKMALKGEGAETPKDSAKSKQSSK